MDQRVNNNFYYTEDKRLEEDIRMEYSVDEIMHEHGDAAHDYYTVDAHNIELDQRPEELPEYIAEFCENLKPNLSYLDFTLELSIFLSERIRRGYST